MNMPRPSMLWIYGLIGAFIIGGQLAFVSGVAPEAVGAFFACKLVGGILAAA